MGVNLIFRIAAVGILVSVICQVLKHSGRDEQAFLTSLAGLVLVLFWMIPYIYDLFETMKNLFALSKASFQGGNHMTIITIAAAGIATVLLAVQLKGLKGEYAAYMVMAAGAFIFFYGTGKLKDILEALERIQGYIKVNSVYLVTLLKMVGITYVAEFASGICKDAGYGSLGNQIEIFGKLSILGISMPILLALFGTLETFLG